MFKKTMKNDIIKFVLKNAKWIGASSLNLIHKQIIDECEPILVFIVKQTLDDYDKNIKQFEIEKEKVKEKVSIDKFVNNFTHKNNEINYLIFRNFEVTDTSYSNRDGIFLKDYQLNKSRKDKYYKDVEAEIREYNLSKLKEVLSEYIIDDFVSISNIQIKRGTKGFEITAFLKDKQDRNWTFITNAIPAGGYNIQVYHYRYIVNLSSPQVSKEYLKNRMTENQKNEKEKKKQEKLQLKQNKENETKIKKQISIIREFGSDYKRALQLIDHSKQFLAKNDDEIRDWIKNGEWGNTHYVQGDDSQLTKSIAAVKEFFKKRFDQKMKDVQEGEEFYKRFYDDKGKLKFSKEQLYEKISNGEINVLNKEINPY